MRFPILALLLCLAAQTAISQRAQRIMLGAQADLIKSDNDVFFGKLQGGIEGSYYFSRKFAATGGVEWWSGKKTIVTAGIRLCPIDEAFIRLRILPGSDLSGSDLSGSDLSLGGGFAKPLSDYLRIEAMGDLYFEGHIAIRAGLAYGFGGTPRSKKRNE